VGAVSWFPGSAADTVTPQPVTVILDNYQHSFGYGAVDGDKGAFIWNAGSEQLFKTGVTFNLTNAYPHGSPFEDGEYAVRFASMFDKSFTYRTWSEADYQYVTKTGQVGTPFLVEVATEQEIPEGGNYQLSDGKYYAVSEAKLITIQDNRVFHSIISEENVTLSLEYNRISGNLIQKKVSAANQYGDITFDYEEVMDRVVKIFVNGVERSGFTYAFTTENGSISETDDYVIRVASGYRRIHLTHEISQSTPEPGTPTTPDPDAKLDIQDVTDPKFLSLVQQLFPGNKVKLFDISLLKAGAKVQPNGSVEVSVPIPAYFDKSQLAIYYVSDDGKTKEKLDGKVVGDTYVFTTTHFSYYALVAGNATIPETGTPGTQNPTTSESPVRKTGAETTFPILSAIIAVIGSAAVIYRKKICEIRK
jgi:hypothetical protein